MSFPVNGSLLKFFIRVGEKERRGRVFSANWSFSVFFPYWHNMVFVWQPIFFLFYLLIFLFFPNLLSQNFSFEDDIDKLLVHLGFHCSKFRLMIHLLSSFWLSLKGRLSVQIGSCCCCFFFLLLFFFNQEHEIQGAKFSRIFCIN